MAITKRLRADGTPAYRVVVHTPTQGHLSIGTFDRKRDAELAEAEYKRASKLEGVVFIPKSTPFNLVAANWLGSLRVKPQSLAAYTNKADHAVYFFDDKPIKAITRQDCEDFLKHLTDTGLAVTSANQALKVLRRVLNYAVECGYIKENKAVHVKPLPTHRTESMRVIAPQDHQRLVQAAGDYWSTLVFVWPFLGLRSAEMVALQWDDFDLDKRTLTVRRQRLQHTGVITTQLKSAASRRTVHFSKMVATRLKCWKLQCPPTHDNWVFPREHGAPLKYHNVAYGLIPALREACDMPELTTHDFRHTFVSYLIAQGADIKYIQHECGHADSQVTLDVYGHLLPSEEYSYADRTQEWYVTATSPREEKAQVTPRAL